MINLTRTQLPPVACLLAVAMFLAPSVASQEEGQEPPNILVIMPDDVGLWNISAYNMGMMGYRTPNIDRLADEGMIFTDAYGEQSCTAGRAAFITGQHPFRTGLLKVGLPGADLGLRTEDPTLAELLQPLGYRCGQFGKNHLGDRNEFLPTVHGFDEFFGNLYHLNAEEEPETEDYPDDPAFHERFGPRGVLHTWATDEDDPTVHPRWGRVGRQRIEDTGPLTRERMETVDDEFLEAALRFMDESVAARDPFFIWFNPTRMHVWTRLRPESRDVTGYGLYADGMMEVDRHVETLLAALDEHGVADNTIVIFTTDNGAEVMSWPDGGTIPFRGEKNTTWEGGFRVPLLVRWPAQIPADSVSNDIVSHQDWLPTLMAAVGQPDVAEQLREGLGVGDSTYQVHVDGHNILDHLRGEGPSPRAEFFYFTDDGQLSAIRWNDWKALFSVQRAHGMDVWRESYFNLRIPYIVNLRMDPFERTIDETIGYQRWWIDHMFMLVPAQTVAAEFLETFREFPPRQRPATFSIDQVLESMQESLNNTTQ